MPRRISVLVPSYNEARALPRALASFAAQRFTAGDEVTFSFLDDGSSDDSAGIVERFAQDDRRFEVVRGKVNRGKSAVLRDAFCRSGAAIVISSDADVIFADISALRRIADAVENGADLTSGNPVPLPPASGGELGPYFAGLLIVAMRGRLTDASMWRCHGRLLGYGERMIRLLREIEWPPRPIGEDMFVFLEALRHRMRFTYVPDAVVHFRSAATFGDYSKQTQRFARDLQYARVRYGPLCTRAGAMPPATLLAAFASLAPRHPRAAARWLAQKAASRLRGATASHGWGTSVTTKEI